MGTGMGMTFYNNLSLNTSVMIPIEQNNKVNFEKPVLNIGLDVYFTQFKKAERDQGGEIGFRKISDRSGVWGGSVSCGLLVVGHGKIRLEPR